MGTWGPGLHENDGARDRVADLVPTIETAKTAEDLAARVGLALWLTPAALGTLIDDGELIEQLQRFDLAGLPAQVRARLRTLAKGSAMDLPRGERSAELELALGEGGVDGMREPLLLDVPHARRLLHELSDRCAAALDAVEGTTLDETFEEFAPLGLLAVLGQRIDRNRVVTWRMAFDRADQATTGERTFWDEAVARVRPLFNVVSTPETDGV
jgi:hypothetical protein